MCGKLTVSDIPEARMCPHKVDDGLQLILIARVRYPSRLNSGGSPRHENEELQLQSLFV